MLRNLNKSTGGKRILGTHRVGIAAETIASETQLGDNGPGLLYEKSLIAEVAGQQLRIEITSKPTSGNLFVFENGAFLLTGAQPGAYSIGFNWYANKVLKGSDSYPVLIGVVSVSAPGVTLSDSNTLNAGSPGASSTAPGTTLNDTSTLGPGGASASSPGNGSAPGTTLSGTSTVTTTPASGQGNGEAPGHTLDGGSSISTGGAQGTQAAHDGSAPGTDLNGQGSLVTTPAGSMTLSQADIAAISAVVSAQLGGKLTIIEKILRNKTVTDPVAGTMTVYDDDGVTPLLVAPIFEDVHMLQRYRGQGVNVRGRLQ